MAGSIFSPSFIQRELLIYKDNESFSCMLQRGDARADEEYSKRAKIL